LATVAPLLASNRAGDTLPSSSIQYEHARCRSNRRGVVSKNDRRMSSGSSTFFHTYVWKGSRAMTRTISPRNRNARLEYAACIRPSIPSTSRAGAHRHSHPGAKARRTYGSIATI
jgi:hypothetical protein